MANSIKEALAIELTKEKIANMDRLSFDRESAYLWYETYEQSLKEIHDAEDQYCLKANIQSFSELD